MIAHTVGPVYNREEDPRALLRSCYQTSLEECAKHGGGVIGFSSISTGVCESSPFALVYEKRLADVEDGYPIKDATNEALDVTRSFLDNNDTVCPFLRVHCRR
jgi:O-acetyl-ADP-ribose deacetylase (regulator of RNase III)